MFAPGKLVGGRYRLVRELGSGGMGVVWAARNEAIERDVAIKFLLPEIARNPQMVERFFAEAKVCGTIRHPGIVDVLDLGASEDGQPFLVMEQLEGESLSAVLYRYRQLEPDEILPVIAQAARTIALAHKHRVVHRDLKPGNLFLHRLASQGIAVKVLDFGISKVLGEKPWTTITTTGATLGSPAYMSPEQILGKADIDERSDLFALGMILYQALAGRLPFDSDSPFAIVALISAGKIPPLRDFVPDVPKPIERIVHACLTRDRERRCHSANELADRIDSALVELGLSASSPTLPAFAFEERRGLVILRGRAVPTALEATRLPRLPLTTTTVPRIGQTGDPFTTTRHTVKSARSWPLAFGGTVAVALGVTVWLRSRPAPSNDVATAPTLTASALTAEVVPSASNPPAPAPVVDVTASPPEPPPPVSSKPLASPPPRSPRPGSAPHSKQRTSKDIWGFE